MDEEQIDMMLTASNFYIKEADKLLKKIDSAKSRIGNLESISKLPSELPTSSGDKPIEEDLASIVDVKGLCIAKPL